MSFSEQTDFGQTLRQLGLRYKRADLFAAAPPLEPPDWLQESPFRIQYFCCDLSEKPRMIIPKLKSEIFFLEKSKAK